MTAAQQRYKKHHHANLQEQTPFHFGHLVYVDFQPFSTSAPDKRAVEAFSKLLPRALGPYHFISTKSNTVTIEQDGIPNMISLDCALLAANSMKPQDYMVDDEQQSPNEVNDQL